MEGKAAPPQKFVRSRRKSQDDGSIWRAPEFPITNSEDEKSSAKCGAVLLEASWTDFMLFQLLSPVNLNKCISVMKVKMFEAGSTILKKGTLGDRLVYMHTVS